MSQLREAGAVCDGEIDTRSNLLRQLVELQRNQCVCSENMVT
jgi:hypothetical protein